MLGFFERRIDPFPEPYDGAPPKGFAAFCWHYCRDCAPWLVAMALFSVAIAIAEVALFGFLGQVVDWLGASDRATFLRDEAGRLGLIAFVVLIALPATIILGALITLQVLMSNLPMSARWRMHRHLLRQSMGFFANEYAGRVGTKVMQTALAVREVAMKTLDVFVYVFIYLVSTLVLVAVLDLRLAIPMAVWILAYLALVAWFVPRLARISETQANARSVMTGRIVDSYTNIQTVKLFSHAGREEAYARDSMEGFLNTVYTQMRLVTWFDVWVRILNGLLVFTVGVIGIWLWLGELASVGAVAAALGLSLRLNSMSQWIMWEASALFENVGTVFDGMAMLTRPLAVSDRDGAKPLQVSAGRVAFEGISFHYGRGAGIIEGLSLAIAPGEKVGLIGRSGAGKSTLVNLLLRFYDVEGGQITIDGQDIAGVTQDSLRRQIGMVTQDTSLLHRTIRENIAYGRPNASEAEILEAARKANALDFIAALEDQKGRRGLDAQVGERGIKLSGGQRQRIAIARIFLKDAPILVLDEATSALDSEVEAAIQDHLLELMNGKTVIAIAHRLSTIAAMDRLVVLDAGTVIEEGRHGDLIAAGGLYADLWGRQTGAFLLKPEHIEAAE